ncbi:alpha/beta hydrolase [Rhodococcoides fascians A25f]|uniref:alpha/beta hydrolase n=1 Tax=Rhodococcoides fascians TaxID=1828 RepID=UPI000565690A|nr:alpha/beta hydrolase [Rhodococcus fascians]QII07382.1 alpha/beta hydrolase [Rhodococcus fascians A25f]
MTEFQVRRPDVRDFLSALEASPPPLFTADVVAMIRTLPPEAMAGSDLPVGELAVISDAVAPGPKGNIALRLFDVEAERGPGPAIVFFHGGGFVVGSIDTHAALAAEVARSLELPVISVDYRLAPEHPWPAAPDDAEATVRWIADGGMGGIEATELILFGDSAGATLSLITSMALRDRPAAIPISAQIALYPATDPRAPYPSKISFADGYGLQAANMALYEEHYASDPTHWRASPLRGMKDGLPPTLLVTAELDPLRDEGRDYAAASVLAGVRTTFLEIPGTIHGFATYRRAIPSAQDDLREVLDLARSLLEEVISM